MVGKGRFLLLKEVNGADCSVAHQNEAHKLAQKARENVALVGNPEIPGDKTDKVVRDWNERPDKEGPEAVLLD